MSEFGKKIKISLYGSSREAGVGVTVENFPRGIKINRDAIENMLIRRSPRGKIGATERLEADNYEFLSGVENGVTTGEKIDIFIKNTDVKNEEKTDIPRPSHADLGMYYKYGESADFRGGAHFSGRLTAPLCIIGAICKDILEKRGTYIFSHIYSLGDISDAPFDLVSVDENTGNYLKNAEFPTLNKEIGEKMVDGIAAVKQSGNSIGAICECAVIGMQKGIGDAYFDGLESRISEAVFAIGGVKGIEFGNGFECATLLGSQNNDEIYVKDGKIFTKTNNAGGLLGGISNGMPIIFRAAIKPTPSISLEQGSVSLGKMENTTVKINGRNDACIALRALPVIEAMTAAALFDALLYNGEEL